MSDLSSEMQQLVQANANNELEARTVAQADLEARRQRGMEMLPVLVSDAYIIGNAAVAANIDPSTTVGQEVPVGSVSTPPLAIRGWSLTRTRVQSRQFMGRVVDPSAGYGDRQPGTMQAMTHIEGNRDVMLGDDTYLYVVDHNITPTAQPWPVVCSFLEQGGTLVRPQTSTLLGNSKLAQNPLLLESSPGTIDVVTVDIEAIARGLREFIDYYKLHRHLA